MTRILAVLLLGLACGTVLGARVEQFEIDSSVLGAKRSYAVLLPAAYDAATNSPLPVLYLLNGLGGRLMDWFQNVDMGGMLDRAVAAGEVPPFVMVTIQPMGGDDKEGIGYFDQPGWKAQTYFFQEFLPHFEGRFRVRRDREGRALAGLSMGGGGSISYAQQHPEMFCAVYAFSPWINTMRWSPEAEFGTPLFNLSRSVQAFDCALFVRRASGERRAALRNLRWFVDVGDEDFLFEGASEFFTAMRDAGIKCGFRVASGDHSWVYWSKSVNLMIDFIGKSFTSKE